MRLSEFRKRILDTWQQAKELNDQQMRDSILSVRAAEATT